MKNEISLNDTDLQRLEKKGYRFVGQHKHSAAKICHWTKKSILNEGVCYKEKFYGIESHRCLQMSPSITFCHHKCLFCWRDISITQTEWNVDFDEATDIIDGCIEAQRNLLCGFFGNSQSDIEKFDECRDPNNAAISLAGEPMLYPLINDLLTEFKKRSFTTFLVSNGMTPSRLDNLNVEPSQLYLSLDAPNEQIYRKLCQPQIKKGWMQLNQSLELLNSFKCRTVIRMTSVKDYNMTLPEEYAKMIKRTRDEITEYASF